MGDVHDCFPTSMDDEFSVITLLVIGSLTFALE